MKRFMVVAALAACAEAPPPDAPEAAGDTVASELPVPAYPAAFPPAWDGTGLPPADALTRPSACPFECCMYGEWWATSPLDVRAEPSDSAPVRFTLPANTRFGAVSGFVRVTSLARVAVLDTIGTVPENRWLPGDTLYPLDYRGEGTYGVWHEGRLRGVADFWTYPEGAAVAVDGEHRTEWWTFVADPSGQTGWLRMDRPAFPESATLWGADACGGPADREPAHVAAAPMIPFVTTGGVLALEVPWGWHVVEAARHGDEGWQPPLARGERERITIVGAPGPDITHLTVRLLEPRAGAPTDSLTIEKTVQARGSSPDSLIRRVFDSIRILPRGRVGT